MKKILFIANSSKPKKDIELDNIKVDGMHKPCIDALKNENYTFYVGTNNNKIDYIYEKNGLKFYNQMVYRNIFNIKDNYTAYKKINDIIKKENIDIIHCNTPIGGVLGRLCGTKNHVKKIIYTAHGFHFFKGNTPIKNIIFKTIEKYLATKTSTIITMNNEDYEEAKKFKLKENGKIHFIHGIGIDLNKFKNIEIDKERKRKELGLNSKDIVLISMGDLVKRKNYSLAIEIIAKCNNSKIKYLICGTGPEEEKLKKQVKKYNIENQVLFLGYRNDIKDLLNISDIFLFTTFQEGLPRSLMEAMAVGIPCIVSNIRGNNDLIDDAKGGFLCNGIDQYVESIYKIIKNKDLKNKMKKYNLEKIKKYSYDNVVQEMKKIYKEILN